MKRLTVKQLMVFNALVTFKKTRKECGEMIRVPASIEDINKHLGRAISKTTMYFHIKALEKKGYVKNVEGKYLPTRDGISQVLSDSTRIKGLYKFTKDRARSGFVGDTETDGESGATNIQGNISDSSFELAKDNSTPSEQRILEEVRSAIDNV